MTAEKTQCFPHIKKPFAIVNNRKFIISALAVFLALEFIIANLMFTVGGYFSFFSFIFVVFACLFCALSAEPSEKYIFTQLGLILTVCADFFLVLIPEQQRLPGMIFFSAAQLMYFFMVYSTDDNAARRKVHLVLRTVASVLAVVLTLAVLGPAADGVALVSMFYYANLLINVVFSFINFKKHGIFAIALLIFILSDTIIGFNNLEKYLFVSRRSLAYYIANSEFDLTYVLYLPSQILLAISLIPQKLKKLGNNEK